LSIWHRPIPLAWIKRILLIFDVLVGDIWIMELEGSNINNIYYSCIYCYDLGTQVSLSRLPVRLVTRIGW
jgi:hypothetical protein